MSDIIQFNRNEGIPVEKEGGSIGNGNVLLETMEGLLSDARTDISEKRIINIPINKLTTLGAGVASLAPELRTITQTTTIHTEGLYRLANAEPGEVLKMAKDGNYWGSLKRIDGTSKFAKLQDAGPLSMTNTTVMPVNPAAVMMAGALFSIEQQLGNIAEMERQILSFLETEKEAEIEADVETISGIFLKYKFNWDNEHFTASNHKLALDIQRTARKNMAAYQKKVSEVLKLKKPVIVQSKVNTALKDLLKKFKYYRLSLYTFAMASFAEIMLSGNFKEEYIAEVQSEIEDMSIRYRDLFGQCSVFLEKMSSAALDANVLKGIGTASKAVGTLIGSIPIVKEGPVDEFLQDGGEHIRENAEDLKKGVIESFAELGNPKTNIFIEQMRTMIQIYNHTTDICFDKEQIYLVTG